ncbi:MAG TPA: hypothetical protein PLJ24_06170 [Anaerolineae bacterium]|nr:hypothetical protein [Anaerolineae bacterium]
MIKDSNKSSIRMTLRHILFLISAFTELVTSVIKILEWVENPQTLRVVSIVSVVAFVIVGAIVIEFAYKTNQNQWRWRSLVMLYVATALYFTWVGSWLIVPAPKPIVIDDMTGVTLWSRFEYGGSSMTVQGVSDKTTSALKLDYTVEKYGWVAIHREISPAMLAGTRAIGFSYRGSGAPNTIELKLFRKPDENGRSAIFGVVWNHATNADDWRSLEAPYSLFVCWQDTGCKPGEVLDPNEVWKIDIAISNKAGDIPGSGTVLIGPIKGIP